MPLVAPLLVVDASIGPVIQVAWVDPNTTREVLKNTEGRAQLTELLASKYAPARKSEFTLHHGAELLKLVQKSVGPVTVDAGWHKRWFALTDDGRTKTLRWCTRRTLASLCPA